MRSLGRASGGLLLCLLVAGVGEAARPGTPVRCGARIAGAVTLDADLGPCPRSGLRLSSGAVLDCAGHAITGTGERAMDGVQLNGVRDAEVRGCRISGFRSGVRIRGGGAHRVHDNELLGNVYGLEAAGGTAVGTTADNVIARNVVRDNRMDGIHLGAGTLRTEVRENHVLGSGQENVYLLYAEACAVTDNVLEDGGSAAIYLKHGKGNTVARNAIRGRPVQIRGDAVGNFFVDNRLQRAAFVFQAHDDRALGWVGFPHHNAVVGGSVTDIGVCVRFAGAHDNRVADLLARGCLPATMTPLGGQESTGNRLTDVVLTGDDLDRDGTDDRNDPCVDVDGDGFGAPTSITSTCPPDDCPEVFDPAQRDDDGDGVGDACDRCPVHADADRMDADHDGVGDACDLCTDPDGDGFGGPNDLCPPDDCPDRFNPDQRDQDLDGIGDACDPCPATPGPDVQHADTCPPGSLAGLDADRIARFRAGLERFEHVETAASGLGPLFNGTSCAECHSRPTSGGSGPRRVTRFGRAGTDGFDPMVDEGGPVRQSRGIRTEGCSRTGEGVPRDATAVAARDTPALYGAGLIAGIADAAILRHADPIDRDGDGISGRANMVGDRVGRFGWKAQTASLADFCAEAFVEELGITNPVFPVERGGRRGTACDRLADPEDDGTGVAAVTDFLTLLAPLPHETAPPEWRGRRLFHRVGCQSCHVASLPVEAEEESRRHPRHARLFSDLLLHDMGPGLGDGIAQAEATGSEFRTAPLWGVGASAPYLHDGRATSLEEAIVAHGGEAQAASDRFRELAERERRALLGYVRSL